MLNKSKSLGVKISKVAHFVPNSVVTNQDIIDKYSLRLKDEWVRQNIGIEKRHWCTNEKASDLASEVFKKLLSDGINPDLLILSTVSADVMTPATACIVQANTTPGATYPAFDLVSACAGLCFAIDVGIRYVMSGMTRVSCIASETRSYYLNKQDRRTVMLFGDGAAGVNLEKTKDDEIGIFYSKTLSDGRFWNSIVVPGIGTPTPHIEMRDASGIFEEAIKQMSKLVNDALAQTTLKIQQISHFIFHQASSNIVKSVAKELNLSDEQYSINFERMGNTTSASVGILLSELVDSKTIKKNDLICMIATGGGFSAGVILFRWED